MVTLTSISFQSREKTATSGAVSEEKTDMGSTNESNEVDKMIIEESLSAKKGKAGQIKLGTNVSFKKIEGKVDSFIEEVNPTISLPKPEDFLSPCHPSELQAAAIKVQKFYKSYRTRRNLADCAVVVEELWSVLSHSCYVQSHMLIPFVFNCCRWKALDFAALKRSSVSFFDSDKSETAVSRWSRARTRAAKVIF